MLSVSDGALCCRWLEVDAWGWGQEGMRHREGLISSDLLFDE